MNALPLREGLLLGSCLPSSPCIIHGLDEVGIGLGNKGSIGNQDQAAAKTVKVIQYCKSIGL